MKHSGLIECHFKEYTKVVTRLKLFQKVNNCILVGPLTCASEIAYTFLLFTIKTARYVVLAFANKVFKPQNTLEKLYNVILRRVRPAVCMQIDRQIDRQIDTLLILFRKLKQACYKVQWLTSPPCAILGDERSSMLCSFTPFRVACVNPVTLDDTREHMLQLWWRRE